MQKYSTKISCEGDVYVEIAAVLTEMGFPMNHCTARNVVLKVMTQIVKKISQKQNITLDAKKTRKIAQSPEFQNAITTVLDQFEAKTKLNT